MRPTQFRARLATDVKPRLRRWRMPAVRTAKTVLAAVLAFAVAEALHTSAIPILAPLTALLVVQVTLYETFTAGRERIVSVVAGVLLAILFAAFLGLTWWSLGLVIAVSIVAGRLLRLGDNLMEVPISAMLVLAVGGNEHTALGRVVETLIGAVVGVGVNLLIAPPLYIEPATAAVTELAERMAAYSQKLAEALRGTWSRPEAEEQLARARRLGKETARADRHLARAQQSARLNPRGLLARQAEPRLRSSFDALEHAQVGLRALARALLDRTFFLPEDRADAAYPPDARDALAEVLESVATALRHVVSVVSAPGNSATEAAVDDAMQNLAQLRDALATRLIVDAQADPAAWGQFGALLDAVDRLRVEVETALRPPDAPFSPPLIDRQRAALRRALTAADAGGNRWVPLWRRRRRRPGPEHR
jgi:uncharacterized membrane protein YgaE (UPF0421/DUF939 family)